ncbi:Glycosyltransferase family 4 protein [Candidatus Hepatincolaceae symbiont of Richtersius coronifer]
MKSIKIFKIYPHNYPLSKQQNASIVLVSLPFIKQSQFTYQIISSYCENPSLENNITFIKKEDCFADNYQEQGNKNIWNVDFRIDYTKYLKAVVSLIKLQSPDLVEVEFDVKLSSDLTKHIKQPVILINHINMIKSSPWFYIKNFFRIRNIAAFIFVSHYFKKRFTLFYPFWSKKAYVVHNSYDHIKPQSANPSGLNWVKKQDQIVFLGKATLRKGIKEYLEAVSLFLEQNLAKNPTWQAIVIGAIEKKREKDTLEAIKAQPLIKKYLDNKKLIIYENLNNQEAFKYLENAKIAIFPTIPRLHQEGIPTVALEAALAKCLIISSLSGGYSEVNPFTITHLNKVKVNEILDKLNIFVNNSKLLQETSQQQHQFVLDNFNISSLGKKFEQIKLEIWKRSQRKNK